MTINNPKGDYLAPEVEVIAAGLQQIVAASPLENSVPDFEEGWTFSF